MSGSSTPPIFTEEAIISENLTSIPPSSSALPPTELAVSPSETDQDSTNPKVQIDLENIKLIGPPSNSFFSLQTPLTVYWDWPLEQENDQQFAVYLLDDSGEHLVGTADEPSLGNRGYQLSFVPGDKVNFDGPYLLEVRLEQVDSQGLIAASNPRTINFKSDFRE